MISIHDVKDYEDKIAKLIFMIDVIKTEIESCGEDEMYDEANDKAKVGYKIWDNIINSFRDEQHHNHKRKHNGDCIGLPITCNACLYAEYLDKAREYLSLGYLDIFEET